MNPEEVASRYNKLPGFRLVDYHSVALPLWQITFDALVIAEKKFPVVDEFILRAVDRGVDTSADLAGFLGLSEKLVLRRLGTLWSSDCLLTVTQPGPDAGRLKLTARGLLVVGDAAKTPPRREKLVVAYDAIARQPIAGRLARESLRNSLQIKNYGLFELPALPGRSPDDEELGRINYNVAIPKETKRDLKICQVLSAKKIGSLVRRYREGVMLVYCGIADIEQLAVRFFSVDGRPMPEVDRGFQLNHGLQRLNIQEQLKKHRESLEQELALDGDYRAIVEFARELGPAPDLTKSISDGAKLDGIIEEKEMLVAHGGGPTAELVALRAEIASLKQEKVGAQERLNAVPVRMLEPQEHVPLFEKALKEAQKRLVIISPWINDHVMEPKAGLLEDLLRRRVEVYIGFGITVRTGDDRKSRTGDRTLAWLEEKSAQFSNLHVVKFGDTHAKILLMDDRFVAVGSFNWMSFGGFDRNENGVRVVREEISQVVTDPVYVEKQFVRFHARFARYIGGSALSQNLESPLLKQLGLEGDTLGKAEAQVKPVTPVKARTPVKAETQKDEKPQPAGPPHPPTGGNDKPTAAIPPKPVALQLTARMIATHLQKKPFVVIATSVEHGHFTTLDAELPDWVIRKIFATFHEEVPQPAVITLLRRDANRRSP